MANSRVVARAAIYIPTGWLNSCVITPRATKSTAYTYGLCLSTPPAPAQRPYSPTRVSAKPQPAQPVGGQCRHYETSCCTRRLSAPRTTLSSRQHLRILTMARPLSLIHHALRPTPPTSTAVLSTPTSRRHSRQEKRHSSPSHTCTMTATHWLHHAQVYRRHPTHRCHWTSCSDRCRPTRCSSSISAVGLVVPET
jgi:hypothetical protein